MTRLAIALSLMLSLSPAALAQDKKAEKKVTPTPQQAKQNVRMQDCLKEAEQRKIAPEARMDFMRSCMQG
jgi:hypothetical protein